MVGTDKLIGYTTVKAIWSAYIHTMMGQASECGSLALFGFSFNKANIIMFWSLQKEGGGILTHVPLFLITFA